MQAGRLRLAGRPTRSSSIRACSWPDGDHHYPVGHNRSRELAGKSAQIFLLPQIANSGLQMIGIAEILPAHADLFIRAPTIKQNYGSAAVLHLLGPHFEVAVLLHALAFAAQRVLIDGD